MKKFLIWLLTLTIALPALARDFQYTYGGQTLTYTVLDEDAKTCKTKDGTGTLTPGNKVTGELKIPATVSDGLNTFSVKCIGEYAFSDCTGITSAIIPNSVISIGNCAFLYCSSLTNVNIPTTIQSIGNETFRDCSKLTNLSNSEFPNLRTIGKRAFESCKKLEGQLSFPALTEIGEYAFYYDSGITSISLSTYLKEIPAYTFYQCTNLQSINNTSEINSIGDYAFSYCEKLASSLFFSALTELGKYSFTDCKSLPSVTISSNLEVIPTHAFAFCRNLSSLVLPTNLIEIGDYAFDTCEAMTDVTLPNSLKKIGRCGFLYCSKLESMVIPENCIELGETIFQGCYNLQNVSLPSTLKKLPNYMFNDCIQLKTINIPASVDSIGRKAFGNTVRLESISIPKSVTYIGPEAFFNCPSLSAINIYADAFLTIEESVFGVPTYGGTTGGLNHKDIRPTAILKVPSNWYNKYKSDPIWGKFIHIEPLTYPIIESFSLSDSKLTMVEGDFGSVKAIDNNAEIILSGLYWSSDNELVATVDTKGIIKAVGPGEAVITCKWITPSGSVLLQTLSIEVKDFVLKIKLPNGYTELLGAARNAYKFRFGCEEGYSLHQAFIDDEDITAEITASSDFVYEVKPARKDRVLYAIFRSDVNTGIETADVANTSNIKFVITEGHISIEGAQPGSEVRLYDINGRMLKSTTIHSFDVEYRGVMILTVDGQTFKFIM